MSIVDDIAQDLHDEHWERRSQDAELWIYGTTDPAKLRAIYREELRLYPDEIGVTCEACGALQHVSLTITCQECLKVICTHHHPTCPHQESA